MIIDKVLLGLYAAVALIVLTLYLVCPLNEFLILAGILGSVFFLSWWASFVHGRHKANPQSWVWYFFKTIRSALAGDPGPDRPSKD